MEAWTSEHVLVPGYRAWARNGHRTYTGPTRAGTIGRSSRFTIFVERKPGIIGAPLAILLENEAKRGEPAKGQAEMELWLCSLNVWASYAY